MADLSFSTSVRQEQRHQTWTWVRPGPPGAYAQIPQEFVDGDGERWFGNLLIYKGDGARGNRIYFELSNLRGRGATGSTGNELIEEWEKSLNAIVITRSGSGANDGTFTVRGPNADGVVEKDTTENYAWLPPPEESGAALYDWLGLTSAGSLQITLNAQVAEESQPGIATRVGTLDNFGLNVLCSGLAWDGTSLFMVSPSRLYTVATTTGQATQVGALGEVGTPTGFTWDGSNLLMSSTLSSDGVLWTVDRKTGVAKRMVKLSSRVGGIAWFGATLYGVTSTNLVTIAVDTGAVTPVGTIERFGLTTDKWPAVVPHCLASDGRNLYMGGYIYPAGSVYGVTRSSLFRLDSITGRAHVVGTDLGQELVASEILGVDSPSALAWDESSMYMGTLDEIHSNSRLYTVDLGEVEADPHSVEVESDGASGDQSIDKVSVVPLDEHGVLVSSPGSTGSQSVDVYTIPRRPGEASKVGSLIGFGVQEFSPLGLEEHQGTVYMLGRPDVAYVLYTINVATGMATSVGTVRSGASNLSNARSLTSNGSAIYLVGQVVGSPPAIFTINPASGQVTRVANLPVNPDARAIVHYTPSSLAWHNGELYGVASESLYRINESTFTAEFNRVGNVDQFGVGVRSLDGMVSHGGRLYAAGDALYTLDTSTGTATPVGDANGFAVEEFRATGMTSDGTTMYMVGNSRSSLYSVEPVGNPPLAVTLPHITGSVGDQSISATVNQTLKRVEITSAGSSGDQSIKVEVDTADVHEVKISTSVGNAGSQSVDNVGTENEKKVHDVEITHAGVAGSQTIAARIPQKLEVQITHAGGIGSQALAVSVDESGPIDVRISDAAGSVGSQSIRALNEIKPVSVWAISNNRLREYNAVPDLSSVVDHGALPTGVSNVRAMAFDASGQLWLIIKPDFSEDHVDVWCIPSTSDPSTGTYKGRVPVSGYLDVSGMDFAPGGHLWVLDFGNRTLVDIADADKLPLYSARGGRIRIPGRQETTHVVHNLPSGLGGARDLPISLTINSSGHAFISESLQDNLWRITNLARVAETASNLGSLPFQVTETTISDVDGSAWHTGFMDRSGTGGYGLWRTPNPTQPTQTTRVATFEASPRPGDILVTKTNILPVEIDTAAGVGGSQTIAATIPDQPKQSLYVVDRHAGVTEMWELLYPGEPDQAHKLFDVDLARPDGLAYDPLRNRLWTVDAGTRTLSYWSVPDDPDSRVNYGQLPVGISNATAIAVSNDGSTLYIANGDPTGNNNDVWSLTVGDDSSAAARIAPRLSLRYLTGLAVDASGNLWLGDSTGSSIYSAQGINARQLTRQYIGATGTFHPHGLTFDDVGNLYTVSATSEDLHRFTVANGRITASANVGELRQEIGLPSGIAFVRRPVLLDVELDTVAGASGSTSISVGIDNADIIDVKLDHANAAGSQSIEVDVDQAVIHDVTISHDGAAGSVLIKDVRKTIGHPVTIDKVAGSVGTVELKAAETVAVRDVPVEIESAGAAGSVEIKVGILEGPRARSVEITHVGGVGSQAISVSRVGVDNVVGFGTVARYGVSALIGSGRLISDDRPPDPDAPVAVISASTDQVPGDTLNLRVACYVPAHPDQNLSGFAIWNGSEEINLHNRTYETGQFNQDTSVSPLASEQNLADYSVELRFRPSGYFKDFLLSGDTVGREIEIYWLADTFGTGEWDTKLTARGHITGVTHDANLTRVLVDTDIGRLTQEQLRMDDATQQRFHPGDKGFEFTSLLQTGRYRVDWP